MRDDSHKFCRGIKLHGRKGKVFNCSTTVLSNKGLVNKCRIRFTKSHQEIREVFQQLKLVRENDGVPELLRFIGDNPDADRKEMEYLFPSLLKNVVPYRPPVLQDYPGVMMNLQNIVLLGTKEEANTVGARLTELLNNLFKDAQPGTVFVGLDMEWNAFDTSASVLQCLIISFPGQKVYALHLTHMGVLLPGKFPTEMKKFLEDKRIRICGSNVGVDIKRLDSLGVHTPYQLDTIVLSKLVYKDKLHHGLNYVAKQVLHVHIDKEGIRTTLDWSLFPQSVCKKW